MKVILQEADKPTANNRIYTKELLQKIAADYTEQYVKHGRGLVVDRIPEDLNVYLNHVVATVKEIKVEDNKLVADIQHLEIDRAKVICALVESGRVECRLSGVGSVTQQPDGTYLVGDDYQLCNIFLAEQ